MTECLFCKIIKKEIPSKIIYEDRDSLAFLDISPINVGHTLVIPKKHFKTIEEMSSNDLSKLMPSIEKISKAILKISDGLVISQRNKRAAGQVVDHVHFHLMPRYKDDGHSDWTPRRNISEKESIEFTNKIKSFLK